MRRGKDSRGSRLFRAQRVGARCQFLPLASHARDMEAWAPLGRASRTPGRSDNAAGSRAGGGRPPEITHAYPLKAHLWLDDPGAVKESVHCLGQEELGRGVRLHTRKKVIRVNFELMSFYP